MSLNWDIRKCVDSEELTAETQQQQTNGLIWWMMSAGYGSITEDNWAEVYARLHTVQLLEFSHDEEKRWITPEVIYRYIGLRTNCSDETRVEWAERQMRYSLDIEYDRAEGWLSDKLEADEVAKYQEPEHESRRTKTTVTEVA